MATLYVMDKIKGDKRIQWELGNKRDVNKAKKLFSQKIKDGFLAVGYKAGEKTGTVIKEFSEQFDRIVLQMPLAGG